MIDLQDVSRVYRRGADEVHALERVSLHVPRGRFVALMGPSGSGKSTLLNILGGIDKPQEGRIAVDGKDITGLDARSLSEYRRHQVGFIFQFYNLLPTLTARENVELGLEMLIRDKAKLRERAEKYLGLVGLDDKMDNFPQELSAGQQHLTGLDTGA